MAQLIEKPLPNVISTIRIESTVLLMWSCLSVIIADLYTKLCVCSLKSRLGMLPICRLIERERKNILQYV